MQAAYERETVRLLGRKRRWTEAEYLNLDTTRRIEFVDGKIEVLPMPTESHQLIGGFLFSQLYDFVRQRDLGLVLYSGLRVRLWAGRIREPDIVFLSNERRDRRGQRCWEGADLVMEVVSSHGRRRDLVVKREEYARAGVAEYWIIDPKRLRILVLFLHEGSYSVHGEFGTGTMATSCAVPGFAISVDEVFAEGQ